MDWTEANREIYNSLVWRTTVFGGRRIYKYPTDLEMYREIITESRPQVIVETGSAEGGSAAWFAQYSEVISVDVDSRPASIHGVTFITGGSIAKAEQVRDLVAGRSCLVTLDSAHDAPHVLDELEAYAPLATVWLVVEDTAVDEYGLDSGMYPNGGPGAAVKTWLKDHPEWKPDPLLERWKIGMNPGGWLRRTVWPG